MVNIAIWGQPVELNLNDLVLAEVEGGFNELIEHKDRHAKILVRP